MCGPALSWDWLVLDLAYVLTLVGGSMVLRARTASPIVWVMFGTLSVGVGGFLFGATYVTQAASAAATQAEDAAALLAAC